MDSLDCVKERSPLINEIEKVRKNGTIFQRNYTIYKKDYRALM